MDELYPFTEYASSGDDQYTSRLILFHKGKDMIAYVILACRSIVQRNNISFSS